MVAVRLRWLRRLRLAAAAAFVGSLPHLLSSGHFSIHVNKRSYHGRVRQGRPGQSMTFLLLWRGPRTRVLRLAHDGRMGLQPCRKKPRARAGRKKIRWSENRACNNSSRRGKQAARADAKTMTQQPQAQSQRAAPAKTSRNSRRISRSMCCRPTSSASIPRTGSSFCTASFIAPSPPRSERADKSLPQLVDELSKRFPTRQDRGSAQAADRAPLYRAGIADVRRRGGRLLGEPRPAAGNRRAKSRKLPRAR